MTAAALILIAMTLVVAAIDWVAVGTRTRGVEYVAKPLTMVVLIAAVLAMNPESQAARVCFVAALVASLVGDVFLMTKRESFFVLGLGAFLIGHVAYIVGLWFHGVGLTGLVVGVVVVVVAVATLGRRIVSGVRDGAHPELATPVLAYIVAISVMVASAFGTGQAFAIAGACLFYASDALIAWNRFIQAKPWGDMAIIVTYHLGQVGLALSLVPSVFS